MPELDDYKGVQPAWCPGCGNFLILKTFKETMLELGLAPHQFTIVSGIGRPENSPTISVATPSTDFTAAPCRLQPA